MTPGGQEAIIKWSYTILNSAVKNLEFNNNNNDSNDLFETDSEVDLIPIQSIESFFFHKDFKADLT